MAYAIGALIFTFVVWKVSAFVADHPPEIKAPTVSVPVWEWPKYIETPRDRYESLLAKIERLPLTPEEREVLREQARRKYISEA